MHKISLTLIFIILGLLAFGCEEIKIREISSQLEISGLVGVREEEFIRGTNDYKISEELFLIYYEVDGSNDYLIKKDEIGRKYFGGAGEYLYQPIVSYNFEVMKKESDILFVMQLKWTALCIVRKVY